MTYKVAIKHNQTGEIRIYTHPIEWGEGSEYLWSEGNYCCDCNRSLFFAEATGDPDPELQCSQDLYSVLYAELPDGQRIEIDEID